MFIYDYHKEQFTLNYLYDQGLIYSQLGSKKATDGVMTGFLRDYMVYIFDSLSSSVSLQPSLQVYR